MHRNIGPSFLRHSSYVGFDVLAVSLLINCPFTPFAYCQLNRNLTYDPVECNLLPPHAREVLGTACHTCKKRKRKCDQARPCCSPCQQRGATCGGYETQLCWGSGLASRGRFTGATLPLKDAIPLKPRGRKRDREREQEHHHQELARPLEYGYEDEAGLRTNTDNDGGSQLAFLSLHTRLLRWSTDPIQ